MRRGFSDGERSLAARAFWSKTYSPLSAGRALATIAGLIGWARCAEILGRPESTICNWSDPEVSGFITLDDAVILDAAYAEAGGQGRPLASWHQRRIAEIELLIASLAVEMAGEEQEQPAP